MTDQTHGAGRPAYRSGHGHDGCASVFEALGWVGALRLDSRHVRHGRGLMAITLFLPFRLDLDLFPCTHREVGLKETFREEYYRTLFGAMQPSECLYKLAGQQLLLLLPQLEEEASLIQKKRARQCSMLQ